LKAFIAVEQGFAPAPADRNFRNSYKACGKSTHASTGRPDGAAAFEDVSEVRRDFGMWGPRMSSRLVEAAAVAFVGGLALTVASPVAAQSGTTICELPEFRGTAIYNRYCVGQSSPQLAAPVPVYDPARSFKLLAVNASGEFRVIKKNGRALTAQDMSATPIEYGDTMLTGPTGSVQFVLPDETVFTLGPNSEMEFDEFIIDPNMSLGNLHIGFVKGLLRLVTGKLPHSDPQVRVAVGSLGIRGTDVEAEQSPDGTGSIKLHEGQAELTPYDSDKVIDLAAGQMISWTDFTNMSGPVPIPDPQ